MAFRMLDGVISTGPSESIAIRKRAKDHTVQVTITGGPTSVTVDLEGSLDNINWFQLATNPFDAGELAAGGTLFHVDEKTVRFIRVNLTVLSGGTSPTVTALYEAFEDRS